MIRHLSGMRRPSQILEYCRNHPVRAGTVAGWVQQGVSGLAGVLMVPILLAYVGSAETGVWLAFQGFVMLAGLADFGVGIAVTRQVAYCLGSTKDSSSDGDFLSFGIGWKGIRSLALHASHIYRATVLIAYLAGAAAFEFLIVHSQLITGEPGQGRLLWYLMLFTPCLLLLSAMPVAILNGVGQIFVTRLVAAVYFGVQACTVAVVAIVSHSLTAMALATGVCSLAYYVCVRYLADSKIRKNSSDSRPESWNPALSWQFVRVAFPLGFVNIGAFLTSSVQVPMVGAILGPTAVAPFFLAQKIGQFLLQAALQFVIPKTIQFSSILGRGDFTAAKQSMLHSVKIAAAAILGAQLVFVFAIPVLAPILLNGKAYPGFEVISWMGVDYVLLGVSALLAQFVIASGKNPFVLTTLIGGSLNLLGVWFFVPRYALLGIPMASILAGALTNYGYAVWCWVNLLRRIRLNS